MPKPESTDPRGASPPYAPPLADRPEPEGLTLQVPGRPSMDAAYDAEASTDHRWLRAKGHGQFAFYNHTVNHAVKAILRSPAHGMVSGNLLVMTVTGRRTGKKRSFPVAYGENGPDRLRIHVDWPEKKVWWRNLKSPSPVSVRLRGTVRTGVGEARGDPKTDLWVDVKLDPV